jgi:hypothetical protein
MDADAADPAAEDYNDGNRAFLQAFMARGTLTLSEGQKILAAIFTVQEGQSLLAILAERQATDIIVPGKENDPKNVTQADFDSFISAAADALSPFDYEIRSTQHQISKERVYALVNSASDPLTQLATTRTPEELFFVKRLMDAMFETFNTNRKEVMAVTGMQAIHRSITKGGGGRQSLGESTQSVDKGLTQELAEKTLSSLVKEGWLERSKNGYYTLSPRALMELRSWLVETYNDSDDPEDWQRIKFCEACKEIVTIGQRCVELDCIVRLHDICQDSYWRSRPDKTCPKCETEWDGKHYVGEKAVTTTEEYLKGKRRSGGASRSLAAEEEEEE